MKGSRLIRRERRDSTNLYISDYCDEEATTRKLSTGRLRTSDNKPTCESGKFFFARELCRRLMTSNDYAFSSLLSLLN